MYDSHMIISSFLGTQYAVHIFNLTSIVLGLAIVNLHILSAVCL